MPFPANLLDRLIPGRHLRSRQTRLRERGYLTLPEAAAALGISTSEVCRRRNEGSLPGPLYGVTNTSTCCHRRGHAIISPKVSHYETYAYRRYQRTHRTM